MNKKQQKRYNEKVRIIKELAIIVPAFSFMHEEINKGTKGEDKNLRDYKLATQICRELAFRIKPYNSIMKGGVDMWQKINDNLEREEHNLFLMGLSLLSAHMELSNKKINIGLSNEIVEMQELCFEFFSSEQINNAADFADKIVSELKL